MSDSSIGPVFDYFLDLANAIATAASPSAIVNDGWPANLSHSMIGVGADRPPDMASGQQSSGTAGILTMGNVGIEEAFGVDHYIYNGSGGTDQKACRDAVLSIWNPWINQLRADLLSQSVPCLVAMVSNLSLEGPKSTEEAANGRYSLLSFTVMCRNVF